MGVSPAGLTPFPNANKRTLIAQALRRALRFPVVSTVLARPSTNENLRPYWTFAVRRSLSFDPRSNRYTGALHAIPRVVGAELLEAADAEIDQVIEQLPPKRRRSRPGSKPVVPAGRTAASLRCNTLGLTSLGNRVRTRGFPWSGSRIRSHPDRHHPLHRHWLRWCRYRPSGDLPHIKPWRRGIAGRIKRRSLLDSPGESSEKRIPLFSTRRRPADGGRRSIAAGL